MCTLNALQNRKFTGFKINDEGKRLRVQNRLEGRLFYSTSRQIMPSFGENVMGRESLWIPVFMYVLVSDQPSSFYQNLESPISLLRCLNIRVLIYLDDILLMSQSIERLLVARDTVTFLLQHVGFVINFKKSVMEPVQTIENLGLVIN